MLTGWWRCARLRVRAGWASLSALLVGLPLTLTATALSLKDLYATPESRESYAHTIGASSANVAFNGRGYGLTTVGGITIFEAGILVQIALPLAAILLAVRHTRVEEDAGRVELLTARPVGRLAPLAGSSVVLAGTIVLASAATAGGMIAAGLPAGGSCWYAASLAGLASIFAAVGVLAAQIGSSARSARSLAMTVFAVLYALRIVVDSRQLEITWLSPIGWVAETRAFAEPVSWPLLASAGTALLVSGLAVLLAAHRDLGAGLVHERRGTPTGSIGSPLGLCWRITRPGLAGWVVAALAVGGIFGGMAKEMVRMIEQNPSIAEAMGLSIDRLLDTMTTLVGALTALLAAAVGLSTLGRAAAEESSGRTGLVVSHRISRGQWWWALLSVALLSAVAIALVGGLALGAGTAWSMGDSSQFALGVKAVLGALPGILLLVCVGAVALALAPRLLVVGWAWFTWASIVALLADTLKLPTWARNLSPLQLTGRYPLEAFTPMAATLVGVTAIGLVGVSFVMLRRRDLCAG